MREGPPRRPARLTKVFFVSAGFPFHRLIYPGSGPAFAEPYGWAVRTLADLGSTPCDVAVLESRLLPEDVGLVERHLARPVAARAPLLVKVSDPENPRSRDPGLRFLLGLADRPGVHFASVYEPAGPLAEHLGRMRSSRVVRTPYPYDRRREVERPLADRARRIFVSGSRNRALYPLRESVIRRISRNPLARSVLARLRHPGYPDLGREPRHDVTGARYVEHAAGFTHFFLDGSRYGVELMKYVECAYAGCVPIGELPRSLATVAGGAFVPFDGRTRTLRRAVRRPLEELEALARAWREALREARDPVRLDQELDERLRGEGIV